MRKVWTTEDYEGMPEGTNLQVYDEEVDEDGDLWYSALWTSMLGSYMVVVPASITTNEDPDAEMNRAIEAYLKSDAFKASREYAWLQEQKLKNG